MQVAQVGSMAGRTLVERMNRRWGDLNAEFSTWKPHYSELSKFLLPRHGRFLTSDRNKGQKIHGTIYDNNASQAMRILAAGMLAGASSPARPWFALETPDPDLNRKHDSRIWLRIVRDMILRVFAKTNTYGALEQQYTELGGFGSGCTLIKESFDTIIHCVPITCGQYRWAAGPLGVVDTMYREFDMTVSSLVREFGLERCSLHVQDLKKNGMLDTWITVMHAIEPREDRDITSPMSTQMPWKSVYWELGQSHLVRDVLSVSGFKRFPVLAPRWSVSGGDVYGNGPGMEALGDTKSLQHQQLRKGQGIDFKVKPPIVADNSLKGKEADWGPGGVNYADLITGNGKAVQTAWDVNLDLGDLLLDIQDIRARIRSSFFADLFLMLASQDKTMTATEVAERHEEKLLMLGPVLDRLHTELLGPLVEITYNRLLDADLLPPPPPDLQDKSLGVEFISMLAQAQKLAQIQPVDRLTAKVAELKELRPDVVDKLNTDEVIDDYGDMLGVNPKLIVPTEKVEELRKKRLAAQQAESQAQALQMQAASAKDLASAAEKVPIDPDSLFSGIDQPVQAAPR